MISLGLSLAVIFIVLVITIDAETITALKTCIPAFLILSLCLHVVSLFFWSSRIKLMCHSLGYKVGFRHCFNLVCSNMFIAAVTPSQIGGEPVRVYEIHKAGVPTGDATAVVIMERVFDGIVLAIGTVICVFALGVFFSGIQLPEICIVTAYIAASVFGGLVILFIVIARHPKWGHALMGKLSRFLSRKKSPELMQKSLKNFEGFVEQFYTTVGHFGGKAKRGVLYGMIFTALYWLNEFTIAFFICLGLGVEPTPELFLLSLIFQLLITVIMMIPLTPGGVGVAELSLGGFYALVVPTNIVGIFVLIYRFIFYYFNLAIGFIASMIIVRREARSGKDKGSLTQESGDA